MPHSLTTSEVLIPLAEQRLARVALNRLAKPTHEDKGRLLYLVGPAGTGKSALIREFVQDVEGHCVVTASEFAAQLAAASDKKELDAFQERFRNVSVFVCEDIHAIEGRPQTLQQLLAAIDELVAHGKDVIVSSTKMPGELESYPRKLVNRFRGGTIIAVKIPGAESRALLLRQFAQQRKVTLSRDALALLAESLAVSSRELSGIVTQLAERRQPIKRDVIEKWLHDDFPSTTMTPLAVTKAVAAEFGVTLSALRSHRRTQVLVLPRQCAMWLSRKLCGTSFTQLGGFFERQHSSVMHAVRTLEQRLTVEPNLRQRLKKIESTIKVTPSSISS